MKSFREQIVAAAKLRTEVVDLPDGNKARVREMLMHERVELHRIGSEDLAAMYSRIALLCCVEEDGSRCFQDDEADLVRGLSQDVLQAIGKAVLRLSGAAPQEGASEGEALAQG